MWHSFTSFTYMLFLLSILLISRYCCFVLSWRTRSWISLICLPLIKFMIFCIKPLKYISYKNSACKTWNNFICKFYIMFLLCDSLIDNYAWMFFFLTFTILNYWTRLSRCKNRCVFQLSRYFHWHSTTLTPKTMKSTNKKVCWTMKSKGLLLLLIWSFQSL